MKIHKWMKVFSAVAASAALLAACGGGGSDPLPAGGGNNGGTGGGSTSGGAVLGTKVVTYNGSALTSVQGGALGNFRYAGDGGNNNDRSTTVTNAAVTANVFSIDGSMVPDATNTYGGIAATLGIAPANANWTGSTKLSIQLAGTGNTQSLNIRIGKVGAQTNGCLPTYVQAVTSALTTYNINLDEATFKLPSFCPPAGTASNPLLTGALTNVDQIQVEDNSYANSSTRTVGIRVGEIGVVGLTGTPTVPPTTPTVTVTVGPNAVISFADGNTATSVQGGTVSQSAYSGNNNGSAVTTPAAITSFTSTGGRLRIAGTNGISDFSGVGANLQLPATANNWSTGGTVSFFISSAASNSNFKFLLNGGTMGKDGCFPTAAVSPSAAGTTITLALNTATFIVPNYCGTVTGEVTAINQDARLADALASMKQVQVEDNNTGGGTVNFTIGEISRVAPGAPAYSTLYTLGTYSTAEYLNASYGSAGTVAGVVTAGTTVFNVPVVAAAGSVAAGSQGIQTYIGDGTVKNLTGTKIKLVGIAASKATSLGIELKKQGGTCNPLYIVTISSTATDVEIDLATQTTSRQNYGQGTGGNCGTVAPFVTPDTAAVALAMLNSIQLRAFNDNTPNLGTATLSLTRIEIK
jgi:Carbohydrate binding domain (family 11)